MNDSNEYVAIETRFKMTTDHKLDLLSIKLDEIKEKQEEMSDAVSKVKEALYGPDEGLYARLRDLESWKKNMSKVIWMLSSTIIGLLGYVLASILDKL